MAAPTLEECTAFLQRPGIGNGSTVFEHVSDILLKLVEERPVNPVDVFEEVSAAVKLNAYNAADAPLRPSYQDHPSIQWARETADQLKIKGPGEDKAVGGDQGCTIQNLSQDALMFEQAGIGVGSHQATSIAVGLRRLAEAEPLKTVRFWGKITGTMRDYIIAEATYRNPGAHAIVDVATDERAKGEEPVPNEKVGEGLNSYVYYVVGYENSADGIFGRYKYDQWIKLPAIRPDHIMAARKIKKLFSGDLEASVNSYPPFPGNEAEYLSAQIARIARGCTMTVNGHWALEEDDDGNQVIQKKELGGEEPPLKSGAEGLTAPEGWTENWVHHPLYPSILSKMGRCKWPQKEIPEGEEEPEEEEKEEGEELMKNVTEEAAVGAIPAYSVRLATPVLNDFSPAVLRSNRWPGAHTIALESTVLNVYLGDGLKFTGQTFQTAMPPALPEECSDLLPGEEGAEEPGPPRPGMTEQLDEPMPDKPFLDVDGTADNGDGDDDA